MQLRLPLLLRDLTMKTVNINVAFVILGQVGATLAVFIDVPIILASVFAKPILVRIFGRAYEGYAPLVIWEGIYHWFGLIYRMLVYYYRTLNSTVVVAGSAMAVAVVSVCACLFLTRHFGALRRHGGTGHRPGIESVDSSPFGSGARPLGQFAA
jgi:hypothetical protein